MAAKSEKKACTTSCWFLDLQEMKTGRNTTQKKEYRRRTETIYKYKFETVNRKRISRVKEASFRKTRYAPVVLFGLAFRPQR